MGGFGISSGGLCLGAARGDGEVFVLRCFLLTTYLLLISLSFHILIIPMPTHKQTPSLSHIQNHKALLATAYNELGKELSSAKLRVVGNYTLGRVIGEGRPLPRI